MLVSILRRIPLLLVLATLAACGSQDTPLTGHVLDAYTRQPIKDVHVQLGYRESMTTDAKGRFTTDSWSLNQTLQLEAPGYEPTTLKLADQSELAQAALDSSPASFEVMLRPTTLTGTVTDPNTQQPIANAQVVVADEISTTTQADGSYILEDVPETFEVAFRAPQYAEARTVISQMTRLDVALLPNILRGTVMDSETNQPLSGVEVRVGELTTTTADDGTYELRDINVTSSIQFSYKGYDTLTQAAPQSMLLDVGLRRQNIDGVVVDAEGKPLRDVEVMLTPTITGTAIASTRTGEDGRYTFDDVPTGAYIKALLPGYKRAEVEAKAASSTGKIELEPFDSKALYLSATMAAQGMPTVNAYFDIIDSTELNSMVLDVKSDVKGNYGVIYYQSQAPAIVEAATSADLMPIREILAEAKRRGIYMIARVQIFAHDNALLQVHPDWYVQKNGAPWFGDGEVAWLDAYDERVWDYNIQLAVEAAQLGFDEIQFDYIRFPTDGNLNGIMFKGPYDPRNNPQPMYEAIGRFTERAHRAINDAGAFFSVDVFGYAAWNPISTIGQNLQIMGQHVDYVYPMVYPSHFAPNELGLNNSAKHPYEIVDHTMKMVQGQLTGSASRAKVKPWLQDFTMYWGAQSARVPYGPTEVRAQIEAAEANRATGVVGWALWNLNGNVTVAALKPQ
jgi:hypothetical protein